MNAYRGYVYYGDCYGGVLLILGNRANAMRLVAHSARLLLERVLDSMMFTYTDKDISDTVRPAAERCSSTADQVVETQPCLMLQVALCHRAHACPSVLQVRLVLVEVGAAPPENQRNGVAVLEALFGQPDRLQPRVLRVASP